MRHIIKTSILAALIATLLASVNFHHTSLPAHEEHAGSNCVRQLASEEQTPPEDDGVPSPLSDFEEVFSA